MKRIIYTVLFLFFCFYAYTQDKTDSLSKEAEKKIKKGWTMGALPAVGYDSDLGFQLGAIANIFYYGDGSLFPQYLHSFYVEASWKMKGSGIFRLNYDSKFLLPKTRFSLDISYLPDNMCDFFGFNGYQSVYNANWDDKKSDEYISRAFYKIKRDIFRFALDLQGDIHKNIKWNAGFGILNYTMNRVQSERFKLPDTQSLYDHYIAWDLISESEKNGGFHPYIRVGLSYDSREKYTNPERGIWADAFLSYYSAFGEQRKYNHVNINVNFHHYIRLVKNRFNLAYRLAYQQNIIGETPFYLKNNHGSLIIRRALPDAMGGGNNLRGILRNRVVGDGFIFANIEARVKVWEFNLWKQFFYIGLNPFFDIGYIVKPTTFDWEHIESQLASQGLEFSNYFHSYDSFHSSAGIGLKIGWNENFVLSADWAMSLNKQDGKMGIYILAGYLF